MWAWRELGAAAHPITLVYVKSLLAAKLSVEVRQYAQANPTFPHESTADQFFTEAQFEAYRLVGCELAKRTVETLRAILPAAVTANGVGTAAARAATLSALPEGDAPATSPARLAGPA